jgi:hypothetical protein
MIHTMSPSIKDPCSHIDLTDSEWRELAQIASRIPPGNMNDEKRRIDLKKKGLAYRDDSRPWLWHLTDKGFGLLRSHT